MSFLSQFSGSGVKSIQRGITAIDGDSPFEGGAGGPYQYEVVSINAVDPAKVMLLCDVYNAATNQGTGAIGGWVTIDSATQITVCGQAGYGGLPEVHVDTIVAWQVIEFY